MAGELGGGEEHVSASRTMDAHGEFCVMGDTKLLGDAKFWRH